MNYWVRLSRLQRVKQYTKFMRLLLLDPATKWFNIPRDEPRKVKIIKL